MVDTTWSDLPPRQIIERLWREAGGAEFPDAHLTLTGQDPVLPSSFRIGAIAQSSIALVTLAGANKRAASS